MQLPTWLNVAFLMPLVLAGALVGTQPTPQDQPPDVTTLGPQVGARVPDFSAVDQNGQTQTLQSIMGPKGAMLVLFRSADW